MPFVVWLPSLRSLLRPRLPGWEEMGARGCHLPRLAGLPLWTSPEPWSRAATGPKHLPILDTVPWATSVKALVQGQKRQDFRGLSGFGSAVGRLEASQSLPPQLMGVVGGGCGLQGVTRPEWTHLSRGVAGWAVPRGPRCRVRPPAFQDACVEAGLRGRVG